ncbi:MAG TPA: putative cytokinetic ring protein SteA [Gaiellaceae bacterium]|nr:putative cytokinetic ring protein SteA [Gaiellaceae bacterium]
MATFVEYTGTARLDRRTKRLVKRLRPDDIAIIDHPDLDRISAEELLESGVRVVVNVAQSSTGAYPNAGPLALVRGGVCLIDAPGAELFEEVKDGEPLVVRGSSLFRNGTRLVVGRARAADELARDLDEQRGRVTEALEAFAENTLRLLREETALLSEHVHMPQLRTRFRDRHTLVVARSPETKRDLAIVGPYVADFRPVLVGVDGGADALVAAGYKPDVIVGDMDSVTDKTLQSGAELVVHAYADGWAPGRDRLDRLGLPSTVIATPGLSEDVAMLLAYEKGAELIVAVGTRFNLIEFLERNRAGMSSTFLTRLRVGEKLVDARGVSRLFRPRVGISMVLAFAFATVAVVAAVLVASPELRRLASLLVSRLRSLLGLE